MSRTADVVMTGWLSRLGAELGLDLGCGCGRFTASLAGSCARIVAVDPIASLGSCVRGSSRSAAIDFCRMDGRRLGFRTASFPVVWEQNALHHIAEWRQALAELFRVSAGPVLISEPFDCDRTPGHRRAVQAQRLFLELQHEVGYSHFEHLRVAELCAAVESLGTIEEREIFRSDRPSSFDEFFADFADFADRSGRRGHWMDRLASLRATLGDEPLRESDQLLVAARKRPRR